MRRRARSRDSRLLRRLLELLLTVGPTSPMKNHVREANPTGPGLPTLSTTRVSLVQYALLAVKGA
jgi:hypothetical protein